MEERKDFVRKERDRDFVRPYLKAEAPILVPGSGVREIEKFAADLRAMDLSGAPKDVQKAMAGFAAARSIILHVRFPAKLKFPTIPLEELSKADSRKIQIARRLRQETTMPLRWIADQLQMGSVTYTAKQLSS